MIVVKEWPFFLWPSVPLLACSGLGILLSTFFFSLFEQELFCSKFSLSRNSVSCGLFGGKRIWNSNLSLMDWVVGGWVS